MADNIPPEDSWRTPEELVAYYMSREEYVSKENQRLQMENHELKQKCADYEKRIQELESGKPLPLDKRMSSISPRPPPSKTGPAAEEESKSSLTLPSGAEAMDEDITFLTMNPSGDTTFYFFDGGRNVPVRPGDKVFICGEMTDGKMREMIKGKRGSKNVYMVDITVQPGMKYTFCFKVGDIITLDAHFPMRKTEYHRNINYVEVIDPKLRKPARMPTFFNQKMHQIEKKRLQEVFAKIVTSGEISLMEEFAKRVGSMCSCLDSPVGLFLFQGLKKQDGKVIMKRLTDQYFIPLASSNNMVMDVGIQEFLSNFEILSDEVAKDRKERLSSTRITVLYEKTGDRECSVVGLQPNGSLEDYDVNFDFSTCRVTSVKNKIFGDIAWAAEIVDKDYAFLTINPIQVFSQNLEPDVYNLIHAHIPSTAEEAAVDLQYMNEEDKDYEKYKVFKKDQAGRDLNYKFIIRNNSVVAILYNVRGKIKELKYREFKFSVGDLIDVSTFHLPNARFARIVNIPIQTCAARDQEKLLPLARGAPSYELQFHCNDRYFAELLGYIDIEIIPDTEFRPKEFERISVCICHCHLAFPSQKLELERIEKKWVTNAEKAVIEFVNRTKAMVEDIKGKKDKMTKKEKEDALAKLQQNEANFLVSQENKNSTKEAAEKVAAVLKETAIIQRMLAVDIRLSK